MWKLFYWLFNPMVITIAVSVVAVVVFVKLNKVSSIYQNSLVKKVKKIKEKQREYALENNPEKLNKIEKKHNKAIKSLERRMKRTAKHNRNIIITNTLLNEKTNLALPHQEPFSFRGKFDEIVDELNKKGRMITINGPIKTKKRLVKSKKVKETQMLLTADKDTQTQLPEVKDTIQENKTTQTITSYPFEEKQLQQETYTQIAMFEKIVETTNQEDVNKTAGNSTIKEKQDEDIYNY